MPLRSALDCLADFAQQNALNLTVSTRLGPHGVMVRATLDPPPGYVHPTDAGIVLGPSSCRTRHEFSAQAESQDLALHRLWACIQVGMGTPVPVPVVLPDASKAAEGDAVRLVFTRDAWTSIGQHAPYAAWIANDYGSLCASYGFKPKITHNRDGTTTLVAEHAGLALLIDNLRQPYQSQLRMLCAQCK